MRIRPLARFICAIVMIASLAGCTLPRSGPTAGEIKRTRAEPALGYHVVTVTPAIAAASRKFDTLSLGPGFVGLGAVSPDTISAGDTISVTVWENVNAGLLTGAGAKNATLDALQVDQNGEIFVPYAGRLQAAGMTPESLRREITRSLEGQTPDPQVEVRRVAGDGATVSVMGGVGAPGVYPIEAPTRRLSAMLAQAGGVSVVPDVAQIKLERRGRTGEMWLQDLYDTPALDVALRAGDRIVVEEDRRSFTALGATGAQSRVNFTKRTMSALEALATTGGLSGATADPTGVFVFRQETPEIANRVLGRRNLAGPQRLAYIINLTSPDGVFAAREFIIRDEDTLYVTEAPFAAFSRVFSVATTAVSLTGSVKSITR